MAKKITKAPEVSGIKISVETEKDGVVELVAMGHVDSVGPIVAKSRNVQKYTPVNDKQYEEIVAMGSLTQAPFSMTVLYDPESDEGINLMESAIDKNSSIILVLELNNAIGTGKSGTTIKQTCKVSEFKVDAEANGKYKASFTAERLGDATVTPAEK